MPFCFASELWKEVIMESALDSMLLCVNVAKEKLLQDLPEDQHHIVTSKLVAYIPDHVQLPSFSLFIINFMGCMSLSVSSVCVMHWQCWGMLEAAQSLRLCLPCVFRVIPTLPSSNHRLPSQKLDDQVIPSPNFFLFYFILFLNR